MSRINKKLSKKAKTHELFSPKIAEKRKRRKEVALERMKRIAKNKGATPEPEKIDNFTINKPLFGPHKILRLEAPIVQRKIAPTEGKPTVNAKTGDAVKKLIHKPSDKNKTYDPAAGAIDAKSDRTKQNKTKGRPRKRNTDAK